MVRSWCSRDLQIGLSVYSIPLSNSVSKEISNSLFCWLEEVTITRYHSEIVRRTASCSDSDFYTWGCIVLIWPEVPGEIAEEWYNCPTILSGPQIPPSFWTTLLSSYKVCPYTCKMVALMFPGTVNASRKENGEKSSENSPFFFKSKTQ